MVSFDVPNTRLVRSMYGKKSRTFCPFNFKSRLYIDTESLVVPVELKLEMSVTRLTLSQV